MRLRSSKIETLLLMKLLIGLLVGSATSAQLPVANEAKEYFLDSPQASKYAVISVSYTPLTLPTKRIV